MGQAGVQRHQAPAVCSACLPPGRRESNRERRGRLCWEERTLSSLPAGHRMEQWCCPTAFATRRPCFSTAQRRCFGGAAVCAAGSAEGSGWSQGSLRTRAPSGVTRPLLSFCHQHRMLLLSPPNPARSLSAVVRAPVPREKAFTLFLPRTCRQTCFAPWHLAPARGPYLQREGLNGLFCHVVRERPKESFLFSVLIQSLRGKAQAEQLRLVPTKRERTRWLSPVIYPASPGALAVV